MRLMFLEDDDDLRRTTARLLRDAGFGVDETADLGQARLMLSVHSYAVLILDRLVPDGDALSLVAERRDLGDATPILLVSAMDAVAARVDGLVEGADDYLVKPFDGAELLARVRALARRASVTDLRLPELVLEDLTVDRTRARVSRAGRPLACTAREISLLTHLLEHAGEVVSRSDLIATCWDEHLEPMSNVVDVKIAQIRRKLGEPPLIHTVRGIGYVAERRP